MYQVLTKARMYCLTTVSKHTLYKTSQENRSISMLHKSLQYLPRIRTSFLYIPFRCMAKQSTYDQPGDMSALQLKRRHRQKAKVDNELIYKSPGVYNITAFPTAEEIDLEELTDALRKELVLKAEHFQETLDFVRATSTHQDGCEPQEMFIFREGVAVLWNVSAALAPAYLAVIKKHSQHRYAEGVVNDESESIPYKYNYHHEQATRLTRIHEILVTPEARRWDKYVVSHVLAATVKLSVWERQQEKYIRDIEFVTEDLKYGRKIQISEHRALMKQGALFSLRHVINLSSCLLRTPDLPGKDDRITDLYLDLGSHFAMEKRVRRLGDKMDHCFEIIALISAHLRDKHKLRPPGISEDKVVLLSKDGPWDKFITSHVMASAVKVSIWEHQLVKYIKDVEFVSEDLKYGKKLNLNQNRMLRKHGAIFALRYHINLSSSLLVFPGFPFYDARLKMLYDEICYHYNIKKRIQMIREKIGHSVDTINLLSLHLRDKHRIHLEWLVLALVIIEVFFESLACIDRYTYLFR